MLIWEYDVAMKLLLTSSGISNPSISEALVSLLGKPVSEASALFVPTAIYPFDRGPIYAWQAISGTAPSPLVHLGWKSMGLLEPTALASIDKDTWAPLLEETDALLVWGGDPLFLSYWMRRSGVAGMLPALDRLVYVGVSAGAIAAASTFGETYTEPPRGNTSEDVIEAEPIQFESPEGPVDRTFVLAHGMGLIPFGVIPHLENKNHPDVSMANAELWAGRLPTPAYAIDDQTAIQVVDGTTEVVSEGHWKLFAQ
jgi:dipeptidase E